jgi:2'-5' RNA ligase
MFEMDLKKQYNQMWEQAHADYRKGQFQMDPCLDRSDDVRFGITLLWRPDIEVKNRIQAFPENDHLDQIRERLREQFKYSNLENSLDKRYRISTAHMTVMRYRKNIDQPDSLVQMLESYRPHAFGTAHIQELELVFNDWYQRRGKVKQLHIFSL